MTTRILIAALLLTCIISQRLHAEQKKTDIPKPPSQTLEDSVSYVTTRIVTQLGGTGTGFFYVIDLMLADGSKSNSLLLISNKHVFYDPQDRIKGVTKFPEKSSKEITIVLNKRRKDGSPIFRDTKRKTFELHGNPLYLEHPNPSIDLACLNVSILKDDSISGRLHIKNLTDEFLRPIDYHRVKPGTDVLFVGYPGDHYDVLNNLPLVRKGSLASIPYIDFYGNEELVIDAGAFPGSSGSPVFVSANRKYVLLGVLTRTLKLKRDTETRERKEDYLGLGIVLKQELVKELVTYAAKRFAEILSATKAAPKSN